MYNVKNDKYTHVLSNYHMLYYSTSHTLNLIRTSLVNIHFVFIQHMFNFTCIIKVYYSKVQTFQSHSRLHITYKIYQ